MAFSHVRIFRENYVILSISVRENFTFYFIFKQEDGQIDTLTLSVTRHKAVREKEPSSQVTLQE